MRRDTTVWCRRDPWAAGAVLPGPQVAEHRKAALPEWRLSLLRASKELISSRQKYRHDSRNIMGRGIKRKSAHHDASASKKLKTPSPGSLVKRDLLRHHYPRVQTLREYLIAKLPSSSRIRRRKLASLGLQLDCAETEIRLSRLLDSCLVCSSNSSITKDPARWEQWISFSQRADESYITLSGGISGAIYSQCEVCSAVYSRHTSDCRTEDTLLDY